METPMSRWAQQQQAKGASSFRLFLFIAIFYCFTGACAQSNNNLTVDYPTRDDVNNMITDSINDIQQPGQTFAANLFTDFAPFLALLGDQMVREYMLQSDCWPDHIMFSMGPLGLTVAIISAIRLCGSQYLKIVFGKGRESRPQAESELTLSTSDSVCEVWDEKSPVRVIGEHPILELRIEYDGTKSCIKPLHETNSQGGGSLASDAFQLSSMQGPPNLSLNATGEDRISLTWKWVIAVFSIILQLGVIAYAYVVQFHLKKPQFQKDGRMGVYKTYPFFNVLSGTLCMNICMLLCSYLVENATYREKFYPCRNYHSGNVQWRPFWIQQSGRAGDQLFGSYIIFGTPRCSEDSFTTLHPRKDQDSKKRVSLLCLAIFLGLGGFFAQITGLRELHFSVAVVVFGQTLLMVLVRALVRLKKNTDKVHAVKLPQGFELEWLATRADWLWDGLNPRDKSSQCGKSDATYMSWKPECFEEWEVVTGKPVIRENIMIVKINPVGSDLTLGSELTPNPTVQSDAVRSTNMMNLASGRTSTAQGDIGGSTDTTMAPVPTSIVQGDGVEPTDTTMAPGPTSTGQGGIAGSTDTTMVPGPASTAQGDIAGSTDTTMPPEPTSTAEGDGAGPTDTTMPPGPASAVQGGIGSKATIPHSGSPPTTLPGSIQVLMSLNKVESYKEWKGQSSDLITGLLKSMKHVLNTLLPPNIREWEGKFGLVNQTKSTRPVPYSHIEGPCEWGWPVPVDISTQSQKQAPGAVMPTLDKTSTTVRLTLKKEMTRGWIVSEEVESLLNFWLFTLVSRCKPRNGEDATSSSSPKSQTFDNIHLIGSNDAQARWDISKWYIDYHAQVYEVRRRPAETDPRTKTEVEFHVKEDNGGVMGIYEELMTEKTNSAVIGSKEQPSEPAQDASSPGNSVLPLPNKVSIFAGRILPPTMEEYITSKEYPLLASRIECTLDQRCAQELLVRLIFAIGTFMHDKLLVRVGGETTLASSNTIDKEAPPKKELVSSKFLNSTLDKLAAEIYNTGICSSIEAAYHLVIPPLFQARVLPEVGGVISDHATQKFRGLMKKGEWLKAADLFEWVYRSMGKAFAPRSEEECHAITDIMNFTTKLCEEANSEPHGSNRGKVLAGRAEAMLQELAAADNDVVRAVGLMLESLQELDDRMDTRLVYQGNDTEKGVQELKEENGHLREQYSKNGVFDILGFTSGHRFTTANTNAAYTKAVDAETAKSRDILQRLPLHYAAGNRDLSCEKLEMIIELTGGVDQRDIDDNTPLHLAASSGNVEFIQLLQKKMEIKKLEVDFNAANILERTPLHRAAAKGGSEMVTLLLENGASVNLEDVSRRTALHHAALGGDVGVVNALLAKRANPALVDIHGRSPLHIAAAAGYTVMVHRLIESGGGALLKMTDKDGKTALDLVTDNAKEKIADFEDNPPEDTPSELYDLHDLLKELLITEEGRNRGWSPLHSAVHSGEKTAVEALLKLDSIIASGGEPLLNLRDNDGATPLHVAARAGHWELVKLLIEKNCDLSSKDRNDEGALMLAVKHEQADVVDVLLKKMNSNGGGGGGDVVSNERNSMGINPLHWAAAHGNYALVVKLVQVGFAEPEDCDKLGMTALHYAALMGHENVAEYLLEQSLDLVDKADIAGDTPLHCAAAGGRVGIVKLLLDKFFVQPGEDPILVRDGNNNDIYLRYYIKEQNKAGETALHCAARGMPSPYFKRMMIFYNGAMLDPEIFTKLDLTSKRWHRNVISRAHCPCPEPQNKITEGEFDGLYQGGCQWQDEFIKLLLTLNGDYVDWSLESDAAGVAQLLLDNGADIEARDKNQESPLHLAARWGRLDVAKTLLQKQEDTAPSEALTGSPIWEKAEIHARDIHEDSPLHLAARWGYGDIVKLLVDEGANVEDGNKYGQSPEELAESHLQFETVSLLQELQNLQQDQRRPNSQVMVSGERPESIATGTAVPAASGQSL